MTSKPHVKLDGGRWNVLWQHRNASKTEEALPYSKARDWCDARNLKGGADASGYLSALV